MTPFTYNCAANRLTDDLRRSEAFSRLSAQSPVGKPASVLSSGNWRASTSGNQTIGPVMPMQSRICPLCYRRPCQQRLELAASVVAPLTASAWELREDEKPQADDSGSEFGSARRDGS